MTTDDIRKEQRAAAKRNLAKAKENDNRYVLVPIRFTEGERRGVRFVKTFKR